MNLIETLLNGNISDAKRRAKNRPFIWLVKQGEQLGFQPLQRWNIAAFLKGHISWEEYCKNTEQNNRKKSNIYA
jgi:hypothetical protein